MNKIHLIGRWNIIGWVTTNCGLKGQPEPRTADEFTTIRGDRFEAIEKRRHVTCKKCLQIFRAPVDERYRKEATP